MTRSFEQDAPSFKAILELIFSSYEVVPLLAWRGIALAWFLEHARINSSHLLSNTLFNNSLTNEILGEMSI